MTSRRQCVVAAAVVREGRLLAARRTAPPEAAGRWELPGGKVEAGETREAALRRELLEELGLVVTTIDWLEPVVPIGERHELRAAVAALAEGGAEPQPTDHDALRWLAADELDDVDWLEPDRPFVELLRDRLRA